MVGGGQGDFRQYVPRWLTVLQRAVQEGLSAFLAEAEELGGLPTSLVTEFHAASTCGDVTRGFVTVRCNQCSEELRLGFTCHGRTVCPACTARRAASTAVHLVDEVLPHCAYRQWTLAFPRGLKVALASDSVLLSAAVRCFVAGIFALQRSQARRLGIEQPRPGAIAFVQTFTAALLLHPHTHVLVPEGVFSGADKAFAALAAASAQTRLPLGDEENARPREARRCAFLEGFSLHANTAVHANDRESQREALQVRRARATGAGEALPQG